jgi:hypothetical protein
MAGACRQRQPGGLSDFESEPARGSSDRLGYKSGRDSRRMPAEDPLMNWVYVVMRALAWNLTAWYGLPAQIVRSGRRIIHRIMGYKQLA